MRPPLGSWPQGIKCLSLVEQACRIIIYWYNIYIFYYKIIYKLIYNFYFGNQGDSWRFILSGPASNMGSRSSARTKSVIALAVRSERWYCVGSPWVNLGPRRTEGRQGFWRNFESWWKFWKGQKLRRLMMFVACWLIFLDYLWWMTIKLMFGPWDFYQPIGETMKDQHIT